MGITTPFPLTPPHNSPKANYNCQLLYSEYPLPNRLSRVKGGGGGELLGGNGWREGVKMKGRGFVWRDEERVLRTTNLFQLSTIWNNHPQGSLVRQRVAGVGDGKESWGREGGGEEKLSWEYTQLAAVRMALWWRTIQWTDWKLKNATLQRKKKK